MRTHFYFFAQNKPYPSPVEKNGGTGKREKTGRIAFYNGRKNFGARRPAERRAPRPVILSYIINYNVISLYGMTALEIAAAYAQLADGAGELCLRGEILLP